jgi:hypothetical protein
VVAEQDRQHQPAAITLPPITGRVVELAAELALPCLATLTSLG